MVGVCWATGSAGLTGGTKESDCVLPASALGAYQQPLVRQLVQYDYREADWAVSRQRALVLLRYHASSSSRY